MYKQLILLSLVVITPIGYSNSEFRTLLNYTRMNFKDLNVNHEIARMEEIVTENELNLTEYGLGGGVFNHWRRYSSEVVIKSLKRTCSDNFIGQKQLDLNSLKSDEYLKFTSKKSIPISIVSLEMVQELFQVLKGQDFELAFSEYGMGCESRAQKMVQLLDTLCLNSAKAFIESPTIQLADHSWSWYFHVAPIIYVQATDDVIPYILDPAIFNQAVPLIEWVEFLRKEHYYNEYQITLTSKHILLPSEKDLELTSYREIDEKKVKKRMRIRRLLRIARPFMKPLKNYSQPSN